MRNSRLIPFLLLAIVVGGAVAIRARQKPNAQRAREELIAALSSYKARGLLAMPKRGLRPLEDAYLQACVTYANEKLAMEFEGVIFNELPKRGWISVCFFSTDPDHRLNQFHNNCAFVGFDNLIVSDLAYVRRFQEVERPPWADSSLDQLAQQFPQFSQQVDRSVWLWLVGHEIGHIAHEHEKLHLMPGNSVQTPTRFDHREEQADLFSVRVLQQMPAAEKVAPILRAALARRIEIWAASLMGTGSQPPVDLFDSEVAITVPAEGNSHLPLFVRAVDISYWLIDHYDLEDPQRYRSLRQRIRIKE